jgi:hypothetical protein
MLRPTKTVVKLEKSDPLKIYHGRVKPPVPPEILRKVITYLVHDRKTLWACYGTCFGWRFITAPHLFSTVTLRTDHSINAYFRLLWMDVSDYLPFVKRVKFDEDSFGNVDPFFFDNNNLEFFRKLENVHDLSITCLELSLFPVGIAKKYFGHFSHKLRSLTLISPRGTRQELFDFLDLFIFLDDIDISNFSPTKIGNPPAGSYGRGLEGRLALKDFGDEGLLRDIIHSYRGMQFKSVVLHDAKGGQLVLDACGRNVKTLRIIPGNRRYCKRFLLTRTFY